METDQNGGNGWTSVMRWTARILALLAGGLFAYFAIEFGPAVLLSLIHISEPTRPPSTSRMPSSA